MANTGWLCKGKIQMRFLKYTAQQMKFKMIDSNNKILNEFLVEANDRTYQIWERNSLRVDLWSEKVFMQKLNYIHNNPCKHPWYLAKHPEGYKYSSAKFYETGIDDFWLFSTLPSDKSLLVTRPTKGECVTV